ncbi:MAG: hypothetical protein JF607_01290 [Burkholderiales bacterium]|nr:hypothetical protein [Burkholderiales bacterium]
MAFLVCLDTEFLQTPSGPCFLSAAFLGQDDSELYGERTREEVEALLQLHPNDFVSEQVLPQLGLEPAVPWEGLAAQLVEWLDGLGAADVEMIYDYSGDYLLVEQLLAAAPRPPRARLHPTNVSYLLSDEDGLRAADSAWEMLESARGIKRHHALADAYSLRLRFAIVHPTVESMETKTIEVFATVKFVVSEFEFVHAESDDGELTLSIGEGTAGVGWRDLKVGQRLRCVARIGASTLVLSAEVLR